MRASKSSRSRCRGICSIRLIREGLIKFVTPAQAGAQALYLHAAVHLPSILLIWIKIACCATGNLVPVQKLNP